MKRKQLCDAKENKIEKKKEKEREREKLIIIKNFQGEENNIFQEIFS